MATNYEKYFGSSERVAASLKDIEVAMADAHRRDDIPGLLAIDVVDPIDWVIEEAGLGCPKGCKTHQLIEWLQEECDE